MKKRIANIITAVSLCLTLLPMMAWAAETTHTVTSQEEFEAALRDASAGDTISISGSVTLYESGQDALVIDKAVTIQGDSHSSILVVRYSGIILGADVTFDNITLQFPSRSRNAIMANGHTLTLNNVARDPGGQQIHLFCGGMTGYTQENLPTQGLHGQIIIRGNTSLGNLYAGSISADGEANSFDKPATITIENPATGTLGSIYASGALEIPQRWPRPRPASPPPWLSVSPETSPSSSTKTRCSGWTAPPAATGTPRWCSAGRETARTTWC